MTDMDETTVSGSVADIVFFNAENGYSVLRLETDGGVVTAAGCVPGVSPGEKLTLTGAWTTHPQYGDQFKVESFVMTPPTGADEILRYLASGIIKNIGPAKARDIVAKYGSASLSVIENEPEKLAAIKGISLKSARGMSEAFRRRAGLRRLLDFFAGYGIKPLVATRVYRSYGDDSLEAVKENPYIMTADIFGAEFSRADAVALDLGFESDCPERLSAALMFELSHNLSNGHTFIPKDKLIVATCELIGAGREATGEALDALCECGDVVVEEIAGEHGCYLRDMFEAERYTAERLSEMVRNRDLTEKNRELIREVERQQSIEYSPTQRGAIELAAGSDVMALTGGPGTGKTTTVRGILSLYGSMGLKTALCAPTGRAAKRLSEMCSREAATIHRLLGASPGDDYGPAFDHDEENPLRVDALIVDESSMIDISLMHSMLLAMKRGCRLVLVGDADQLPSVGPGNVFADIIKSGVVPTVALSEIFRQAEGSGIVKCAHEVNRGIMPDFNEKYRDIFFLRRQQEDLLAETVAELYGKRLPENMGMESSRIQVLSPTRKNAAGTAALNERLREAANPPHIRKSEKQNGERIFRVGDKVMQTRNNYDIVWKSADGLVEGMGVYNGDVGVLKAIDNDKETVTIDYDDKLVTYLFEQLAELEPAFAMTVHKAQGSEYDAVILAMTNAAPALLTRSVLYTAMTRARELLVIVGNAAVMEKMVSNDRRQRRYSGLRARLSER